MSLVRTWIPSPNYSSRGDASVRLLVLHTAEGARTIESLGGYFQGNVQASSHVGADDKVNTIGEYVRRDNKAWTQSEFNPVSVSIELCGFAAWSLDEWHRHPNMLDNCAKWIAEEASHYGIPITALTPSEAQGSGRGVCQHVDLGIRGGGHHDCGPEFPYQEVLSMARGESPDTPPTQYYYNAEGDMIAVIQNKDGRVEVFIEKADTGEVFHKWQKAPNQDWVEKWVSMGTPGK